MAGYSGTPLPQKLGVKPAHKLALLHAPDDFARTLGPLPDGVVVTTRLGKAHDVIVFFTTQKAELDERFKKLKAALVKNGGLWIAWPKRTSGVVTDVNENTVRNLALAQGLVDNKVCAIDETWSALRCVYRLADR